MKQTQFVPTAPGDLFPAEDYKLQMRFTRGEPAVFFGPTQDHAALVAERGHWLQTSPDDYSAIFPGGEPLMCECAGLARAWNGFDGIEPDAVNTCLALGKFWEADFLLLQVCTDGEIRLTGGCLCFPSHWRLKDKIGKSIEFIHSPVPGLNATLGTSINKFLTGLKPGVAWQRVNWGITRSPEFNQHPDRHLPRLDANVGLDEVWLRVEEQALVALPTSAGILFGIRIVNHPLTSLRSDVGLCASFCSALTTMPEDMARYKHLLEARPRLLQLLQG